MPGQQNSATAANPPKASPRGPSGTTATAATKAPLLNLPTAAAAVDPNASPRLRSNATPETTPRDNKSIVSVEVDAPFLPLILPPNVDPKTFDPKTELDKIIQRINKRHYHTIEIVQFNCGEETAAIAMKFQGIVDTLNSSQPDSIKADALYMAGVYCFNYFKYYYPSMDATADLFIQKAAEKGHVQAMRETGIKLIDRNFILGIKLLIHAFQAGDKGALQVIQDWYQYGRYVQQSNEIAEEYSRLLSAMRKPNEKGDSKSDSKAKDNTSSFSQMINKLIENLKKELHLHLLIADQADALQNKGVPIPNDFFLNLLQFLPNKSISLLDAFNFINDLLVTLILKGYPNNIALAVDKALIRDLDKAIEFCKGQKLFIHRVDMDYADKLSALDNIKLSAFDERWRKIATPGMAAAPKPPVPPTPPIPPVLSMHRSAAFVATATVDSPIAFAIRGGLPPVSRVRNGPLFARAPVVDAPSSPTAASSGQKSSPVATTPTSPCPPPP